MVFQTYRQAHPTHPQHEHEFRALLVSNVLNGGKAKFRREVGVIVQYSSRWRAVSAPEKQVLPCDNSPVRGTKG